MTEAARWGESTPWSVGVEEELMLVSAETLRLDAGSAAIVAAAEELALPGRIKTELFACVVELNSGVCETAADATRAIAALRAATGGLAAERGLRLMATGTHPVCRPEEQPIADEPRYAEFVAYAGVTARRQGVNGLHVHVGMPSADACYQALEAVLPWLPVLLALSANSPYLAGDDTGLASNRAEVLAQLPRSGAPPALRSYREWEQLVDRLVAVGAIPDYTMLWWDVRPHPRFGTLEVRMPDQPTRLERTAAFTALVQALAVSALRWETPAYDPPGRAIYQQNRWAALRRGADAELVHPCGDRVVPARELAAELVDLVAPVARELGTSDVIAPLASAPSEADEQLDVGRSRGLLAVCARLVERTLPSG